MSNPPEPSRQNLEKFTPAEIAQWREAFALFDQDGDHSITASEITRMFESLGQTVTEEQVSDILAEFDANKNGMIDFDEFLTMMAAKQQDQRDADVRKQAQAAFAAFDADHNNLIDIHELMAAMKTLGEPITLEEAQEMMAECDSNGDGFIDQEEFTNKIFNFF